MKGTLGSILVAVVAAPAIAVVAAVVSAQEGGSPGDVNGAMLACPDGAQVQERFSLDGDAWSVTGVMTAGPDVTITVAGPSGDVTVVPTINLEAGPGVAVGQPVTMKGTTVAATGEMVATSLVDACAGVSAEPSPEATGGPEADDDEVDAEETDHPDEEQAGAEEIADADEDDEGDEGDDDGDDGDDGHGDGDERANGRGNARGTSHSNNGGDDDDERDDEEGEDN
jgi:hypothetical protein